MGFSKNTGVGCHFLLQGIFLIQGLNPHPLIFLTQGSSLHLLCLLHWQAGFFVIVFVINSWQPLGNLILVKNPPANAGHRRDTGSILGSERFLGGWHGNLPPGFLPGESHEERRSRGLQSIKTELKWLNAHIYEDFIFPFHSLDRFEILYVAIDARSFTFFRSPRFCLLLGVVLPFLLLERGESSSCHSFCCNPALS